VRIETRNQHDEIVQLLIAKLVVPRRPHEVVAQVPSSVGENAATLR
jgi:hypothetical protein